MSSLNTSKAAALIVIIGIPAVLFLNVTRDILSPREWAIGMIGWFAMLLLWTMLRKRAARPITSSAELPTGLDDRTRKRISRVIWINKVWIGLLVVGLLFGTANGVAHHAWLPTLVGLGINQWLMWFAVREIRRQRQRLDQGFPRIDVLREK
jgi:Na+/melibiose symporter-like transporter